MGYVYVKRSYGSCLCFTCLQNINNQVHKMKLMRALVVDYIYLKAFLKNHLNTHVDNNTLK